MLSNLADPEGEFDLDVHPFAPPSLARVRQIAPLHVRLELIHPDTVDTHFSIRLWESVMVQDSLQGNFLLRSTTFAFQNDEVNINGRLEKQQLAVLLGPNTCRGTQHYMRMQNPYFSFLVKQQKFKISFSLQWTVVRPIKKQMAITAMPIVHCASSQ
jgi:hypothetical protein